MFGTLFPDSRKQRTHSGGDLALPQYGGIAPLPGYSGVPGNAMQQLASMQLPESPSTRDLNYLAGLVGEEEARAHNMKHAAKQMKQIAKYKVQQHQAQAQWSQAHTQAMSKGAAIDAQWQKQQMMEYSGYQMQQSNLGGFRRSMTAEQARTHWRNLRA